MAPRSGQALSRAAAEADVFLAPLSRYTIQVCRQGWLFDYAGYEAAARVVWGLALHPLPNSGTPR